MGVKKNILYTTLLTCSNYIFPLIVYPYVSRVLEVANIGLCSFIDSIINYFILISMMGISIMGTREIAINKSLGSSLSASFSSLLTLNGVMTLGALFILGILTLFVPELYQNREMMGFGALKILSNLFLIEWFYKGIEDFRFITIRSIVIKTLFVISVYLFVKEKSDYKIYFLLSVLMVTGNAIINFLYSKKFTIFNIKTIRIGKVAAAFFTLGGYILLSSLYTNLNVVFLGFVHNDTQVGYYSTSVKLYSIMMAIFSGVTSVLMPRMSGLLAQNRLVEFKEMIKKTTKLLFSFTIPVVLLCVIFAPQIILIISGPGYEGAIGPMRIVMPLMLIIGYEQIQIWQCLTPLQKDKTLMKNAAIGAIVGVALNLILVPHYAAIGSAWTWVSAEVTILLLSQIALNKVIKMRFPWAELFKSVAIYLPLLILLIPMYFFMRDINEFIVVIVAGVIMSVYFICVEIFVLKDPTFTNIISNLKLKMQN